MTKRIVHITQYQFEGRVERCELETCLEPQGATFHQLVVKPLDHEAERFVDGFGNTRQRLSIRGPFRALEIHASSTVAGAAFRAPAGGDAARFLRPSERVPHLGECVAYAQAALVGASLEQRLRSFVERIRADFVFDVAATNVESPLQHFVERRRGVCQDYAHFAIACLRAVGIPAVYISGYRGVVTSKGRSHAWVAAQDDEGAWTELDPTLGLVRPEGYVVLGGGRDYDDVPPVRGTLDFRGGCRMLTRVRVETV